MTTVKFTYSEKATKFCEISTLLLSVCTVDKSKVEISQNFAAFSEYTNFTSDNDILQEWRQWGFGCIKYGHAEEDNCVYSW